MVVQLRDQRRVEEVQVWSVQAARGECFVETSASTHALAAAAGPQRQPVQIHTRPFKATQVRGHGAPTWNAQ
jgi:hypothetical protein